MPLSYHDVYGVPLSFDCRRSGNVGRCGMADCFTIHGVSYAFVNCYSCGVNYLIPEILNRRALQKRGGSVLVYCPNGHQWQYIGETEADKLRRERDILKQDQARLEDEIATQRRLKEKAEKETRRIKRRAVSAVCPCCNRSFANVGAISA